MTQPKGTAQLRDPQKFVVVTGVVNSPPKSDFHSGFLLTQKDFASLLTVQASVMPLCVEHEMNTVAGRVLNFWEGECGELCLSAFIDCDSRAGATAANLALSGAFGGFSFGMSFDRPLFDATGGLLVNKLFMHEVSLVATPDDPMGRIDNVALPDDSVGLLRQLERWDAYRECIASAYRAHELPLTDADLDFYFKNPQFDAVFAELPTSKVASSTPGENTRLTLETIRSGEFTAEQLLRLLRARAM